LVSKNAVIFPNVGDVPWILLPSSRLAAGYLNMTPRRVYFSLDLSIPRKSPKTAFHNCGLGQEKSGD
jgi:hypothetical protein